MAFYCNICDKSINHFSKKRHNKTKRHYFMKKFVTIIYNYNDFVWDDVETTLHENIISHTNKFNEFKIYVSCKVNDDVEIKKHIKTSLTCMQYYLLSLNLSKHFMMWEHFMSILLVK